MDDLRERIVEIERATRENAIAVERAAADAKASREMALEIRPLILERSGDVQRRDKFETNVNQAHDKIREQAARIEALEKWRDRLIWTGIGVVGAAQAVWWLLGRLLGALEKL